jgi:hypothetical protein
MTKHGNIIKTLKNTNNKNIKNIKNIFFLLKSGSVVYKFGL